MNDALVERILCLLKLSLLAFGCMNAVYADMQRDVVARGWMTSSQFAEALALSPLVPGPSVTLVVIPIGYAAAGPLGAVVALVASAVPTVLLALGATRVWERLRTYGWAGAFGTALAPLALGLVLASTLALGREIVQDAPTGLLVLGSVVILLRTQIAMPAIILGAGACSAFWSGPSLDFRQFR
jgi:chromate transporter